MLMRKFLRIRLEQTGGRVNPWISCINCTRFFCAEGVMEYMVRIANDYAEQSMIGRV